MIEQSEQLPRPVPTCCARWMRRTVATRGLALRERPGRTLFLSLTGPQTDRTAQDEAAHRKRRFGRGASATPPMEGCR